MVNIVSVFLILNIYTFIRGAYSACNYKPCNDVIHTMCNYSANINEKIPECQGKAVKQGLKIEYKEFIVDLHNRLRQKVALGKEPGQPKASNMMVLSWNDELETVAQRWANQCLRGHDKCRDMINGTSVGQNYAMSSIDLKTGGDRLKCVELIIQDMWFGEVKYLRNAAWIELFNPSTFDFERIADYTQMVWAETTMIGCGYIEMKPDNERYQPVVLVCNYAVGGNEKDGIVYKTGDPCSSCSSGRTCSGKYDGLCGVGSDSPMHVHYMFLLLSTVIYFFEL